MSCGAARPTNHKVFGEYTAVLAGDALQTEAFRVILGSSLSPEVRAECARILAEAAGADGMCAGQQLDMDWEGRELTENELSVLDAKKTGAIIEAACLMGCAVGGGDAEQRAAASEYARCIGLAFQIRDDMLDALSTDAELGKPIGSDKTEGKTTYMSLLGEEECARRIAELNERARSAVRGAFREPDFLCALADSLAERRAERAGSIHFCVHKVKYSSAIENAGAICIISFNHRVRMDVLIFLIR